MYQNLYPYTPVYGYTSNLYNNYPNMQWSENEYRVNYTPYVSKTIVAPADVEGYFSKGTQIFIHGTYFDSTTGEQIVIVAYPVTNPNTGVCSVRVKEFHAAVLDGIQLPPES
ncbi:MULTISPECIES: hypothetical protein [Metabacillus]|uniref:Uncharacterized protein n=2 Tax=Metabacillus TaxID=2675233 RepID=A0A179T0B4_9BACI|nr:MULTISPECIES: hypothetical protein [Metabacillus]OAS86948.1 hypothetical protein A6K24_21040 [Metabacillus litoralis]QNF27825.1 hypothetical protein HUW50_10105 [Metabacillus sp. KUDC1714]